jgi:hypothetical protein
VIHPFSYFFPLAPQVDCPLLINGFISGSFEGLEGLVVQTIIRSERDDGRSQSDEKEQLWTDRKSQVNQPTARFT